MEKEVLTATEQAELGDKLLRHCDMVGKDYYDKVKCALDAGGNVNTRDRTGCTALLLACKRGLFDTAKLLIEYGADVNLRGGYRSYNSALSVTSNVDIAKLLISSGANVNSKSNHGRTDLMQMVEKDSLDIAKLLIENNVSINVQDADCDTALMEASLNLNGLEMAKLLLDSGADFNIKNNKGQTALSIAIKFHNTEIIELLKEYGATV